MPTGGVKRPIIRFRVITTPKCTGSMPRFMMRGMKIGRCQEHGGNRLHEAAHDEKNEIDDEEDDHRVVAQRSESVDHGLRDLLMDEEPSEKACGCDNEHDPDRLLRSGPQNARQIFEGNFPIDHKRDDKGIEGSSDCCLCRGKQSSQDPADDNDGR